MKCNHCGEDAAVKFGKDRKGQQRYRCLACRKTFVESHALAGMQTGLKEAVGALRMLLEGMSVRATSRLTGLDRDTILRLMVQAGEQCRAFMEANIHDVKAEQVELDEQWANGCQARPSFPVLGRMAFSSTVSTERRCSAVGECGARMKCRRCSVTMA